MITRQGPIAVANVSRSPKRLLARAKELLVKLPTVTSTQYSGFALFTTDVEDLDKAQTTAKDKTPAALADRDAKALKVYQHIGHIVDYAQGLADAKANAADAVAVILSLGLSVKKVATRTKPELAAKYTGFSSAVLLVALAIEKAGAYFWEHSLDQKTWTAASETTIGKTTIVGLTPGQVYYFRFRALTNKGKSDYSQVVSLIAH